MRRRSPASGSRPRCSRSIRRSRGTYRCCSSSSACLTPIGRSTRGMRGSASAGCSPFSHGPSRPAAAARRRCFVEDLHWIDDASAVFLEALVAAVAGTRTLVVATCRPEYEGRWAHTLISLGPLDADETGDLVTQLLGRDQSLDGLEAMIAARTRGNPFFIEEIVQALVENGYLAGTRGKYELASELDGLVLPATVQAGLAARMDRLPRREKALVQTMSVIGGEIPGPLLSEVCELGARELADAIDVLARAMGDPPGWERRSGVGVQAPVDPGGRVRLAAVRAPRACAPNRRRRDRADLPRRARRARCAPRPPLGGASTRRRPS
jgi:hypothetical protein